MVTYTKAQIETALDVKAGTRNADVETYLLLQEIRDLLTQILAKP